ncbi:MAG: polyhydroxyalkanoate synthesis repressor PhaR [Sphingomonadaceae bacterium]
MTRRVDDGSPIVIKKYANRRLYNTGTSSYITLEDIADMVREGVEFQVLDAKSGEDITHQILTQIIMDQESQGDHILPVGFLRDLISMYGNSMQTLLPGYLEASMASFHKNRDELAEAFTKGMAGNPLAKIAETNMAMMRAATEAFMPGGAKAASAATPSPSSKAEQSELSALREQMAAMQKKLDDLAK